MQGIGSCRYYVHTAVHILYWLFRTKLWSVSVTTVRKHFIGFLSLTCFYGRKLNRRMLVQFAGPFPAVIPLWGMCWPMWCGYRIGTEHAQRRPASPVGPALVRHWSLRDRHQLPQLSCRGRSHVYDSHRSRSAHTRPQELRSAGHTSPLHVRLFSTAQHSTAVSDRYGPV